MRLMNTETLTLETHDRQEKPPYAILSHRWTSEGELLFADVEYNEPSVWLTMPGDKTSSSELTESLNSIFQWYLRADVCYAILDDIHGEGDLGSSKWFTRGWTLQELVTPQNVKFFNKDWEYINDRFSMVATLSSITGIDEEVLRHGHNPIPAQWADHVMKKDHVMEENWMTYICTCGAQNHNQDMIRRVLNSVSTATIMSWASRRETTREEDLAYCLMGLFDVNMPLFYGEKEKAFYRLQEEIIRRSDDQSILAWCATVLDIGIKPRWSLKGICGNDDETSARILVLPEGLQANLLLCGFDASTLGLMPSELCVLDCKLGSNPLTRPAIILRQQPGSEIYDRQIPFVIMAVKPGNSTDKGILYAASVDERDDGETFTEQVDESDDDGNPKYEPIDWREWQQEVDLRTAQRRRIIISNRHIYADVDKVPHLYGLPPPRVKDVVDCDGGQWRIKHVKPVSSTYTDREVSSPSNDARGVVSLVKSSSQ
ncbi:Uu.00g144440.m01.CDS01 [Anthostomella pinea]|uniref:Uu.00g144440.m01.CDS01 n=1 Tax=Anthostomella pinea TaxID=933095 RepID=A0AAI8VRR5_9PEZI|nr:Uu.00g144440.m01.CDS01 [Anthostomella pinea]